MFCSVMASSLFWNWQLLSVISNWLFHYCLYFLLRYRNAGVEPPLAVYVDRAAVEIQMLPHSYQCCSRRGPLQWDLISFTIWIDSGFAVLLKLTRCMENSWRDYLVQSLSGLRMTCQTWWELRSLQCEAATSCLIKRYVWAFDYQELFLQYQFTNNCKLIHSNNRRLIHSNNRRLIHSSKFKPWKW